MFQSRLWIQEQFSLIHLLLIGRSSSVFNAFLANLPQMLDQNHLMGASILEAVLHTLLYAPSTATVASVNSESSHNIIYSYSLWRLEPHVRRSWLMAVEVIMYKVKCWKALTCILLSFSLISGGLFFFITHSMNTHSHLIVKKFIIWYESFSIHWKPNFTVVNVSQPLL